MLETEWNNNPERHPVISLLLVFAMVGIGFILVGPMIGFFFALPFYPGSMMDMAEQMQSPASHPELKLPLFIIQGFATLVGLILVPYLILRSEKRSMGQLFSVRVHTPLLIFLVTAMIVIVFMAVNSMFVEWNETFKFPEFARSFERWAREKEDIAMELTKFLTKFDSLFELALALVVIAVLPAIGEEIVFRGLIQNYFYQATRNPHVAIWVSAFLFSAIHVQFFGFVPRLLLGALFGYLYYWSGNLWLSVFAHFVNNGFSVVVMYFYQQGAFDYDMEKPESLPATVVFVSAAMTAALLYYFYRYFRTRNPDANYL